MLDNIELPEWVYEVLSMGPKRPIRNKFNETYFLADIDIFLSLLKNQKKSGENLSEKEAVAKAYAKNVRQTPKGKRMNTVFLPAVWLRQFLLGNLTWKIVLGSLKFF